jgi:hypothetical protein
MSDAVVFNGLNSLDFVDVRRNVCRIPEVVSRIRQAQQYVDENTDLDFDFLNFIVSDDKTFLSHIRYKSLAACIVQVGLFDRYLRYHKRPSFMIGNINGDSALQVACGVISFESMTKKSAAFADNTLEDKPCEVVSLQAGSEPVLSGFSLTEYAVFGQIEPSELAEGEPPFAKIEVDQMGVSKIVHKLVDEHMLGQIVNIGPGNLLISRTGEDLILDQLAILESIDLDPMLSWFWPELKQSNVAS